MNCPICRFQLVFRVTECLPRIWNDRNDPLVRSPSPPNSSKERDFQLPSLDHLFLWPSPIYSPYLTATTFFLVTFLHLPTSTFKRICALSSCGCSQSFLQYSSLLRHCEGPKSLSSGGQLQKLLCKTTLGLEFACLSLAGPFLLQGLPSKSTATGQPLFPRRKSATLKQESSIPSFENGA